MNDDKVLASHEPSRSLFPSHIALYRASFFVDQLKLKDSFLALENWPVGIGLNRRKVSMAIAF